MNAPFNAADRRHVRERQKSAKLDAQLDQIVISTLMSDQNGRRWMYNKLSNCHIFHTTHTGNALQTGFLEGERNIGLMFLADIMAYCPDQWVQMIRKPMDAQQQQIQTDETTQKQIESETNPNQNQNQDQQKPPAEGSEKTIAEQLAEKPSDKEVELPEKYEFKLPEGYELDEKVNEEAQALFKELKLDNPSAQKLVDFYISKANEAAQAPYDVWADTQKAWVDEIKADPEIGGKLDVVRPAIARTIDLLPQDLAAKFREAMIFTGAGNHPAFVKGFYLLSQMLAEGKHVSGGGPAGQSQGKVRTGAAALYPNNPSAMG